MSHAPMPQIKRFDHVGVTVSDLEAIANDDDLS